MRHFQFGFLQPGAFTGQQQLGVAHARHFATEPQRHRELDTDEPIGEFAAGQRLIAVRAALAEVAAAAVRFDQLFAQPDPLIVGHQVQSRQEEVLRGNQFQLAALDQPAVLAQFAAAGDGFAQRLGPVERHLGGGRLIDRPNQPAVAGRQPHQISKFRLGLVEPGQRPFHGGAEDEVLVARLGLFVGGERTDFEFQIGVAPVLQVGVAAGDDRVELAIGVVYFPVGRLRVVNQVAHRLLEIA